MPVELPAAFRRSAGRLTAVALALFALPFPYYVWSRATGALPSESEWWSRGMNHGPWRWELPAALVVIPMYLLLLLVVVAVVAGVISSLKHRQAIPLAVSLVQAGAFVGLFYAQAKLVFWTID